MSEHGSDGIYQTEKRNDPHGTKQKQNLENTEKVSQNACMSEHGLDGIYQTEKRNDPHGTKQRQNLENTTNDEKTGKVSQNAGISEHGSHGINETEKKIDLHGKQQILDLEETSRNEQRENSDHTIDKIKNVQNDLDNLKDELAERIDDILTKDAKETFNEDHRSEQDSLGKKQRSGQETEEDVTLGHNETTHSNDVGGAEKENGDFLELGVIDAIMDDNSVVSMSQVIYIFVSKQYILKYISSHVILCCTHDKLSSSQFCFIKCNGSHLI